MPTFWVLAGKPLPSWANTCLADVERIRIDFPYVTENAANGPVEVPADAPTVAQDSGFNVGENPAEALADPPPPIPGISPADGEAAYQNNAINFNLP